MNWADIAPGSGQGNAAPMLQVNRNEAFFTRQFTVYINGQTFLATQGSTNCTYSVEPNTSRKAMRAESRGSPWPRPKAVAGQCLRAKRGSGC